MSKRHAKFKIKSEIKMKSIVNCPFYNGFEPRDIRIFAIFYIIVFSVLSLAPIFFVESKAYPPDSSHFLNQVNLVIEAINGKITWFEVVKLSYERTYVFQVPIALTANWIKIFSPHFYLLLYWLFYVIPIPFLWWRFCLKAQGELSFYNSFLPLIFFADPTLHRLAAFGFFTEVPSITLSFASFVLAYEIFSDQSSKKFFIKTLVAAFLLCAGVLCRMHTAIMIILPAYAAFLAWVIWPISDQNKSRLKLFAVVFGVLFIVFFLIFKIWAPFFYSLSLAANFGDSIWKYGNNAIEYGLESVYWPRFKYYFLCSFSSFFVMAFVCFAHFLKSKNRKEKSLIWIFLALIVYQTVLWALTLPINSRYITNFAFFGLIFLALKPLQTLSLKILSSAIIGVFLIAGIYDLLPATVANKGLNDLRLRFEQRLLAHSDNSWNYPLYSHSASNLIIPNREIFAAVDKYLERSPKQYPKFFTLTPYRSLINFVNLTSFRATWRKGDSHVEARENLMFTSSYVPEMLVKEFYLDGLRFFNIGGMINSDLILATNPNSVVVDDYAKNWPETEILNELFRARSVENIGLVELDNFYVIDRLNNNKKSEHVRLYEVSDRQKWRKFVLNKICSSPFGSKIIEYCGFKNLEKNELVVDQKSLAKSLSIYSNKAEQSFVFAVKLNDPDSSKFQKIHLHFMPNQKCKFISYNFFSWNVVNGEVIVVASPEIVQKIERCSYQNIRVGVTKFGENKSEFWSR